jgi:transposase
MPRYSAERKAAVLAKLLPPLNRYIPSVAAEERISEATLYNWRQHARKEVYPVPGSGKKFDDWPVDARLATIIETAALSASELSAYCRSKGLYPDQVSHWKSECLNGLQQSPLQRREQQTAAKQDKKRINQLERELYRKEKALAETAALLVLRKKLNALWGDDEDNTPPSQSGNNS